jgi:ankyrin repeat protein
MIPEEEDLEQMVRDFTRRMLEAQIRWQKTNPRLQEHPPVVFECRHAYLRDGDTSIGVAARLLSDTPCGLFDELPTDLVMQSESYGDHWFVKERVVFISGARKKTRTEVRQEGNFLLWFSPLHGMRTMDEGEFFRQVASNRTLQMQDIVKGFPQVNQRDVRGFSSLHWAAHYGYTPLISYLIERGEDINGRTFEQETPVMEAVSTRKLEALQMLLRSGAQVDARDTNEETALMTAVSRNSVEVATLLLRYGADPNVQGGRSKLTLLHRAVENRLNGYRWGTVSYGSCTRPSPWLSAIKIVACLLEHGAKIQKKNEKGKTALFLARQAGDQELAELLKRCLR